MLPRLQSGLSAELLVAYLAIALKHLRLMFLLLALALQLGLTYYTFARPVFHTKSLVHVQRLDRPMDRNVGPDAVFIDNNDRTLLSQFASDYMIERTAARLGVQANRRQIATNYLKQIRVQYDPQGNILVEVWPFSAEWARDWTEAMVHEYLLYREEKRMETRELIIESFSQELEQIGEMIDSAFKRKYDFKESSEMDRLLIEFEQLNEIPRDLLAVNRRLSQMNQARDAIEHTDYDTITRLSLLSFAEERATQRHLSLAVGQMLPDGGNGSANRSHVVLPSMINPMVLPWEELEREHRRLHRVILQHEAQGLLYGHPKMIELRGQLDEVNHALDLELEVATERFNLEFANLRTRQSELENRLSEVREVTRRHQRHLQEFNRFDAGELAWTNIHDRMTKHISALDFWSDKERVHLQFMGHLEYRDFPVAPNRLKFAFTFLLLGVALATGVPFFLEYVNSRVSDPDQLEHALKILPLGMVPFLQRTARERKLGLDAGDNPDWQEHFRIIRTNLLLNPRDTKGSKVILVSSSLPSEGKTTVALHMAKSLAQRGERTLLIDTDLRRGRLHKTAGISARPGLKGILEGKVAVADSRVSIGENLELLPCGGFTSDAAELIDSARFADLLISLRAQYDRIIIDSPPVLGLSEASIIQKYVDGVLMVVWSEFTPLHAISDAVRVLQSNGATITGFVLNRVDFNSVYSQYRYSYYSPDYYQKYARTENSII